MITELIFSDIPWSLMHCISVEFSPTYRYNLGSILLLWSPCLSHGSLSIAFIFPYIAYLRYFDANTKWYLHFHFICAKLFLFILDSSYGFLNFDEQILFYHRRFWLKAKAFSFPDTTKRLLFCQIAQKPQKTTDSFPVSTQIISKCKNSSFSCMYFSTCVSLKV